MWLGGLTTGHGPLTTRLKDLADGLDKQLLADEGVNRHFADEQHHFRLEKLHFGECPCGLGLTLAGTRTYAQFGLYLTAALLWRMRWLE